jgi:hypothetical protein
MSVNDGIMLAMLIVGNVCGGMSAKNIAETGFRTCLMGLAFIAAVMAMR